MGYHDNHVNVDGASGRTVCVTGAGGFIASWLVKLLHHKGFTVRGAVQNPDDVAKNAHLRTLDGAAERLTLVQADLLDKESLAAASRGCEGVFHTAAFQGCEGLNGTRNVINAAADVGGIRRVPTTSSIAAASNILKFLDGSVETYANAAQAYMHVRDGAEVHARVYEAPARLMAAPRHVWKKADKSKEFVMGSVLEAQKLPADIHDQGQRPTCVIHSIAVAYEIMARRQSATSKMPCDVKISVDNFIDIYEVVIGFKVNRENRAISRPIAALELFKIIGVLATSSEWEIEGQLLPVFISSYKQLHPNTGFKEVSDIIKSGTPVMGIFHWKEDFDSLGPDDVYEQSEFTKVTHMVTFIGFSTEGGYDYLIFMNSHGTGFGDNGVGRVKFADIRVMYTMCLRDPSQPPPPVRPPYENILPFFLSQLEMEYGNGNGNTTEAIQTLLGYLKKKKANLQLEDLISFEEETHHPDLLIFNQNDHDEALQDVLIQLLQRPKRGGHRSDRALHKLSCYLINRKS